MSLQLPGFALTDSQGRDVALPETGPALVCFVKEDCPTCNTVMPILEALHRQWGDRLPVLVLGQTEAGNQTLIDNHQLSVPIGDDSALAVSFAADIDTVPTLFVAENGTGSVKLEPRIGFVREEWQSTLQAVSSAAGLPASVWCRACGVWRGCQGLTGARRWHMPDLASAPWGLPRSVPGKSRTSVLPAPATGSRLVPMRSNLKASSVCQWAHPLAR